MVKLTIFAAYNNAKKDLQKAGIENFGFEARQIIKHITGYNNTQIMAKYNEQLSPLQQTIYNELMQKRKNHYPLQYMLGCWDFYGLEFFVGEGVLSPRADTEALVDTALEELKGKSGAEVLDLCSGTGCIAIAIAKNSDARLTALEKYEKALGYLKKNVKKHKADIEVIEADVFDFTPSKKYDLIVSNPPYIAADEMEEMNTETSFEPDTALYGGEDGLMFYRHIVQSFKHYIKKGGKLMLEVGFRQAETVSEILKTNGYTDIGVKEDYNGIQRVVFGTVK